MKRFTAILLVILILIFTFSHISYAENYIWNETEVETSTNIAIDLKLDCGSAILIEQNTGKVIYEQNSHDKLRPASVTKVMTILLIMEALDSGRITLTDKIPCSENAASMGGSQIWLDTKEELTVDEMLKAICIVSANDCCVAMAEYLEGSCDSFVSKMNQRAKELGMNDTSFKNCHGLDTDNHLTSAYDIALMSRELLVNHPSITKYTSTWMDTLRDGKSTLTNTNKLIRNYKGCTGLKTGSTSLALFNLSAVATRDDLSLIAVIMKAPTSPIRFSMAKKLLDYGFSNFTYKQFAKSGDILKSINIDKGAYPTVNIVYEQDASMLIKKGEDKNIEQIINLENNVLAPIYKGKKLGEIQYVLNNEIINNVNLVAENDVKKSGIVSISEKLFLRWFRVLR